MYEPEKKREQVTKRIVHQLQEWGVREEGGQTRLRKKSAPRANLSPIKTKKETGELPAKQGKGGFGSGGGVWEKKIAKEKKNWEKLGSQAKEWLSARKRHQTKPPKQTL